MTLGIVNLISSSTILRVVSIPLVTLALTACEVSDSPSSGSVDFSNQAGTYNGTATVNAAAPGFDLKYTLNDEPIKIVVANNGKVTVTFMGHTESKYISGRAINVTLPVDETAEGYQCKGQVEVAGQFTSDNKKILGNVKGDGTCTKDTTTSPVTIRGTLEASK